MFSRVGAYTNFSSTATFTNLMTNTLKGNVLTNLGDTVRVRWGGRFANAVVNTNNFKVIYGSETLLDTGMNIASNNVWRCEVLITRTGNTGQHVEGRLEWGPNAVPFAFTNVNLEAVQTNGIDTLIALQGAARRPGAHTNTSMRIYFEPQN